MLDFESRGGLRAEFFRRNLIVRVLPRVFVEGSMASLAAARGLAAFASLPAASGRASSERVSFLLLHWWFCFLIFVRDVKGTECGISPSEAVVTRLVSVWE